MRERSRWQGRNLNKDRIRLEVWQTLMRRDAVTTSPVGKIPAFRLAHHAASRLAQLDTWAKAKVIKCNPDTAQLPVRQMALEAGKTLLMAIPQLIDSHCFVMLTSEIIRESGLSPEEAAFANTALKVGLPMTFAAMPKIDAVIVGCVAVDRQGGRIGKGAGFADLELGMLQHFGLIDHQTPIIATADSCQVIEATLPMEPHDWPLDWVITPHEAIATKTTYPKPKGLNWPAIQPDQWASIPALKTIRKAQLNSELVIRPVQLDDAPQLLAGVNRVIAEQHYLGSAEPFTTENQRPYLEQVISNQYPMVVAEVTGQIIGNCDVIPYAELGFRHVGRLGMWVLPEFRGLGVGRSLLVEGLAWAHRVGLEKVELQVYADNEKAIALYTSTGFAVEGQRVRARKLNEHYQDLVHMGLFLPLE